MTRAVRQRGLYARILAISVCTGAANEARAFCGFFAGVSDAGMENGNTQTVIVRECNFTTMTLQFNYRGDLNQFTVVFPVPVILTEHDVRVVDSELIRRIDTFTAPRAVRFFGRGGTRRRGGGGVTADATVRVEAEFVAGEYQILILSAGESFALFDWLNDQGFHLPAGATPVLEHYIDRGMFFLAARVTLDALARDDFAFLSPLQMTFQTDDFGLPILMGTINASDQQDLLIYAIADDAEVQVSNYPTVRLDRSAQYQPIRWGSFNEFVDAQFEATRQGSELKVVTEYVGPVNKGDPPTTNPITREELRQLGYRGNANPHVTRLHLRYTPQQVGEDLMFTKTEPLFFTPNFTRIPSPGDFDDDGDVDLADFMALDACSRGAGQRPVFSECYRFDLDGDGDVDLGDWIVFQSSFTGSR